MAEGNSDNLQCPTKKQRLQIPFPDDSLKQTLLHSIKALKTLSNYALIPSKFLKCNSDTGACFTNAYCVIQKSSDVAPNVGRAFGYATIFQHGIEILERFLENPDVQADTLADEVALCRLMSFFQRIDRVSMSLDKDTSNNDGSKMDTFWAVQLAHHLLSELAVKQTYSIDQNSNNQLMVCRCCKESISGDYADTSLGNEDVWHGSVDLLMGQHSVTVKFVDDFDPDSDDEEEDETDNQYNEEQIIAQTIVSAFLQKKMHEVDYDNFLIPTIATSKTDFMVYLYDPDHDILLQTSQPSKHIQLVPPSVLALWLTINYPFLGTGITDKMLATGYTADFLSSDDERIRNIYQRDLKFGNCRNKSKKRKPINPWIIEGNGKPLNHKTCKICTGNLYVD